MVLQDSFQVVDSRQLIRKVKDRHIFLFDLYLVICKEVKDSNGKTKYIYKSRMMVRFWLKLLLALNCDTKTPCFPSQKSEMGVTEHMEGDECKFAIWTGRTPMSENKTVLKVTKHEERRESADSAIQG